MAVGDLIQRMTGTIDILHSSDTGSIDVGNDIDLRYKSYWIESYYTSRSGRTFPNHEAHFSVRAPS